MRFRTIAAAIIAICALAWWSPVLNTVFRYMLVILSVTALSYTVRSNPDRPWSTTAIYTGAALSLLFVPDWMIPFVAMPIIILLAGFVYAFIDFLKNGAQPTPETHAEIVATNRVRRNSRKTTSDGTPSSQHLDPDLDTDSITISQDR